MQADIENAIEAIKKSVIMCNKLRKKTSIMSSITKMNSKVNYDEFTEGMCLYCKPLILGSNCF